MSCYNVAMNCKALLQVLLQSYFTSTLGVESLLHSSKVLLISSDIWLHLVKLCNIWLHFTVILLLFVILCNVLLQFVTMTVCNKIYVTLCNSL